MHITYIANSRIPTERANGIQVVHTCEALANDGMTVELVVPRRLNSLKEDPYGYYGVQKNFSIRKVPSLDLVWFGKIGFFIQEWTFLVSVFFFLLLSHREGVIYVRGERLARGIIRVVPKRRVFLESHMVPKDFGTYEEAFKKAAGIIVITKYYENELRAKGLKNVLYAPDGVTISSFDIALSKKEAREKLGLPFSKKIAIYAGHLYAWKGADVLANAARLLPENTVVVFVGGSPEDMAPFKKKYDNDPRILIVGQRPYKEIPLYLKAADVLVLPNTAKETVSRHYTSPVKLFEYMASGRPIIASDLPSIRDVLNEKNAVLVPPDNPEAFAGAIIDLLNNHTHAEAIATMALRDVQQYSWSNRARSIINFITKV